MTDIKVSIILPVYNAEDYLDRCIISILDQTIRDIEIIIINDGSTDKSREIILDYCKKDNRIIFIDSKNTGVSASRNKGIELAKGKFIGFVDADDYLDRQMYEVLYQAAEVNKADLVVTNTFTILAEKSVQPRLELVDEVIDIRNIKVSILNDILQFKFDYSNWNKLYSRDIVIKNNIRFAEKMSIWEDLLFNLLYIQRVNVLVTVKKCFYYYRVHDRSIMTDSTSNISKNYNLLYNKFCSFCGSGELNEQLYLFKKNRSLTCFSNIMLLNQRAMKNELHFVSLYRKFTSELKALNDEIYLFEKPDTLKAKFQYFLLEKRWFSIYSFFYVSKIILVNKWRN